VQDRFDQGVQVGTLARIFPGGVLIDLSHNDPSRVEATRKAIDEVCPPSSRATFIEDGPRVHRRAGATADGFTLIEVKSSSKVKTDHIPDAAIQTWVARKRGSMFGESVYASHPLPSPGHRRSVPAHRHHRTG
jgi:hypothetical protein